MPTDQWTARVWREFHVGTLTRAYRDVLLTLRTFRGAGGACWPSHATLAARARCSARTASRALRQARLLGLVAWTERRVRAGWRWLRTSNAYWFAVPETPIAPEMRPVWQRRTTTGQAGGGGEGLKEEAARQGKAAVLARWMAAAARLPDLLAMRRAAMSGARPAG